MPNIINIGGGSSGGELTSPNSYWLQGGTGTTPTIECTDKDCIYYFVRQGHYESNQTGQIQGSNDGSTWTNIVSVTASGGTASGTHSGYKYYRGTVPTGWSVVVVIAKISIV